MTIKNAASPDFLSELLVCCHCREDLEQDDSHLVCTACRHRFPIVDGIPKFIELAEGDLDADHPIEHRQKYERRYQTPKLAKAYNDSFALTRRNKARSRRELHIIRSLLSGMAECEVILDVPCGGGRLSAPLAEKARHLLVMDASLDQVRLALDSDAHDKPRFGAATSAHTLPLPDRSVDGTMDARLSHHMPSIEERARLLDEVLRVSKDFVLFSFTDRISTHSLYRKLRGKPVNPATMRVSEIEDAAERNGVRLEKIMSVFNLGSRHRFALLTR